MRYLLALLVFSSLPNLVWAEPALQLDNTQSNQQAMQKMSTSNMKDGDAAVSAMHSMEGSMDMGPHMRMTEHRTGQPGDALRAQQVVEEARKTTQKYVDYYAALAAGFVIFHPEIPQKIYHFVNYDYAAEAAESFNPDHPTALLYEKHDDNYKLVGVMYTAPRRFSEDELNQRIPLSVAQWHEHVNDCVAPPDQKSDLLAPHPRFGLRGSIATKEACDAAGGSFHPVVFNWMVHVYPFEKDQAKIWSVERQQDEGN
jgi:hypothetical protein